MISEWDSDRCVERWPRSVTLRLEPETAEEVGTHALTHALHVQSPALTQGVSTEQRVAPKHPLV